LPTAGLAAQLIIARFLEHLPLYRQAEDFARNGVDIPPNILDRWMLRTQELLSPVADAIHAAVLAHTYLQIDESPHPYLEPGHSRARLGFIWAMHVPRKSLGCFRWNPSRSKAALIATICENYRGTLGIDAYQVYLSYRDARPDEVELASCMAHIRRRFEAALDEKGTRAAREAALVIHHIGHLYGLERELRSARAGPALRGAARARRAVPILARLEKILRVLLPRHRPKSPMGRTLSYALSRWPDLRASVTDGRVELDNNLVENDIRPLKLGAKNSLFVGSAEVGHLYAAGYTLVENAERYGLDVRAYLIETIEALATHGPRIAAQPTPMQKTTSPHDTRSIAV